MMSQPRGISPHFEKAKSSKGTRALHQMQPLREIHVFRHHLLVLHQHHHGGNHRNVIEGTSLVLIEGWFSDVNYVCLHGAEKDQHKQHRLTPFFPTFGRPPGHCRPEAPHRISPITSPQQQWMTLGWIQRMTFHGMSRSDSEKMQRRRMNS